MKATSPIFSSRARKTSTQASPRNLLAIYSSMPWSFSAIRLATTRLLRSAPVCGLVAAIVCANIAVAQQPQSPARQEPEVLRVKTELIQTDVMVFDRDGRFVDDLSREQFELRIDGKPRTIEFFERITAGSPNEERQLAAARGSANGRSDSEAGGAFPLDRGRPVFFFVDDLHLDPSSIVRTRQLLTKFVDNEMGQTMKPPSPRPAAKSVSFNSSLITKPYSEPQQQN